MKLRTELISEIRTLAVTFTSGDQLRDWIEEASDNDIQEALGARVRTIASAMSRLEIFMEKHGYEDTRGDDYDAQVALNDEDEAEEDGPLMIEGEEVDEDGEELVDPKRMAEKLKKARARYEATVAYSGRLSSNTGDDLSIFLAGMTPEQVCEIADSACAEDATPMTLTHWDKYSHLNPGSIRMNAGNKIRSRVKAGIVTLADLKPHDATGGNPFKNN